MMDQNGAENTATMPFQFTKLDVYNNNLNIYNWAQRAKLLSDARKQPSFRLCLGLGYSLNSSLNPHRANNTSAIIGFSADEEQHLGMGGGKMTPIRKNMDFAAKNGSEIEQHQK